MAAELTLPALKSLGELADAKPVIVVDNREQAPLIFTRLASVEDILYSGDYSVLGLEDLFSVERKSIDDLVGCCTGENRERLERELHRLRGFRFKRLIIIGSRGLIETQHYHSRISPKAVLGSLASFEIRFDLPVVYCPTPEAAALQIESWAFYFCREYVKRANDLWRSTKATIGSAGSNPPHELSAAGNIFPARLVTKTSHFSLTPTNQTHLTKL
jgi:DNA excision repair protein ERCC-4